MTEAQEFFAYPRMMYQKGGGYTVVASEEEEKGLKGEWSRDPNPEVFSQFSSHHTTQVPVQDPSRVASQEAQRSSSDSIYNVDYLVEEVIRRLQARDLLRRPPGRPPVGSRNPADEE